MMSSSTSPPAKKLKLAENKVLSSAFNMSLFHEDVDAWIVRVPSSMNIYELQDRCLNDLLENPEKPFAPQVVKKRSHQVAVAQGAKKGNLKCASIPIRGEISFQAKVLDDKDVKVEAEEPEGAAEVNENGKENVITRKKKKKKSKRGEIDSL